MTHLKLIVIMTSLLAGLLLLPACEDFVQSVDDPIDTANPASVQTEDQMPFFMDGVRGRFHITHDVTVVIAEGLSDALVFDQRASDATFPTFRDIDEGDIIPDNNSVDGPFNQVGRARFLAEELLTTAAAIDFEDADLEREVIFTGNIYSGLSYFYFASYYGLTPDQQGSPIDGGPFISYTELYATAIQKFTTALNNAPSAYFERVANSMIGKTHLYLGNFGTAQSFLENGLVAGDAPFQSEHSLESQNAFAAQAGRSRNQFTVDPRFADFIDENPEEANRIIIETLLEGELAAGFEDAIVWRQFKYEQPDNIDIITWQENNLMLAELDLQGVGVGVTARDMIDEVRVSREISPLDAGATVDIDLLLEERDKELWLTGNRLIDQRRYDRWHLADGTWKWFPITQNERNENENL